MQSMAVVWQRNGKRARLAAHIEDAFVVFEAQKLNKD